MASGAGDVAVDETRSDRSFYDSYVDFQSHSVMLADVARNTAYAAALARAVRPSDVVVDLGAGTGVLSVLAAKCGARCVIALEPSALGRVGGEGTGVLEQTVCANRVEDKVLILNCNAESAPKKYRKVIAALNASSPNHPFPQTLEGAADVLVSEWMGFYLLHEGMLRSLLTARDSMLKKDGLILPTSASIYAAPAHSLEADPSRFATDVATTCGVVVAGLDELKPPTSAPSILNIPPSQLTGAPTCLTTIALATAPAAEGAARWAFDRVSSVARFKTCSPTNAVAIWFAVCFGGREGGACLKAVRSIAKPYIATVPSPPSTNEGVLVTEFLAKRAAVVREGNEAKKEEVEVSVGSGGVVIACEKVGGECPGCGLSNRGCVVLDTSPSAPPTHWKQTVISLPCTIPAGENVRSRIVMRTSKGDRRCYTLSVGLADADEATTTDATTPSEDGEGGEVSADEGHIAS